MPMVWLTLITRTLKIDPETGKKKPVYRWNFEELTDDIYQATS